MSLVKHPITEDLHCNSGDSGNSTCTLILPSTETNILPISTKSKNTHHVTVKRLNVTPVSLPLLDEGQKNLNLLYNLPAILILVINSIIDICVS